ncbi:MULTISPECIES: nitroreductase family protein [unclassified Fusibacter]|uniref:nitroreductase family protein n=1 Tax=unclassified Fusibacter TaxID=2624464 RepID=UPI001011D61D|nr:MULTISPECIES: nitroreductase family protein [unclassified Fusibacter]MCK8059679.1 nitroreductase family protein [Fusibacter sp. A2]NPE21480.1 nitroreductase family protein [Fusibacter sp. A1]RXV61891.1 nitroreductase family protein [Fusibacter sp. A1]
MNTTIECIKSRRSTRKYTDEAVRQEDIEQIIEAGLYAPSAHNTQPWHITVLKDRSLVEDLNKASLKLMENSEVETFRKMAAKENFDIFYHASVVMIISGEEASMNPKTDCAAATQNMLIAAESLGLGTCWVALVQYAFKSQEGPELIKRLKLPKGYSPYYAVTLGHKKISGQKAPKRRENTVNYV